MIMGEEGGGKETLTTLQEALSSPTRSSPTCSSPTCPSPTCSSPTPLRCGDARHPRDHRCPIRLHLLHHRGGTHCQRDRAQEVLGEPRQRSDLSLALSCCLSFSCASWIQLRFRSQSQSPRTH